MSGKLVTSIISTPLLAADQREQTVWRWDQMEPGGDAGCCLRIWPQQGVYQHVAKLGQSSSLVVLRSCRIDFNAKESGYRSLDSRLISTCDIETKGQAFSLTAPALVEANLP